MKRMQEGISAQLVGLGSVTPTAVLSRALFGDVAGAAKQAQGLQAELAQIRTLSASAGDVMKPFASAVAEMNAGYA